MDQQLFRDAMAHWAAGVAIVAARDGGRIIATTVSALTSLSADPPTVLLALGPNATVRPFLSPGEHFGISILGTEQRRLATIYADPLPVGPDPFESGEIPLIRDALVALICRVTAVHDGAGHAVLFAAVEDAQVRHGAGPLIRFGRTYHTLGS